jgi:hypothetical protein
MLNAEVVQRSAEWARKAREANAVALREEVFNAVQQTAPEESVPVTTQCQDATRLKYQKLLAPAPPCHQQRPFAVRLRKAAQ